jgi:hypothetical protein
MVVTATILSPYLNSQVQRDAQTAWVTSRSIRPYLFWFAIWILFYMWLDSRIIIVVPFPTGSKDLFSSKASAPHLGPTQPIFSSYRVSLALRLRMSGALLSHRHTLSWHGQRLFYLYFNERCWNILLSRVRRWRLPVCGGETQVRVWASRWLGR